MKELSIEEKAKAYDGLIERLKDLKFAYRFSPLSDTIEEIFPELKKESDNERVRNKLIEFFKGYSPDEKWWGNITQEDILAWLEKQGEQKPVFEMKTPEESLGIESDTYSKIVDECIYGGQKPAEWSIFDYRTWQYIISDVLTKKEGIGQYLDSGECKKIAKYMQEEWSKKLCSVQHPAEWGEENEKILDGVITNYESGYLPSVEKRDEIIEKLESLKYRHTWKPSEKQMDALHYVTNFDYGGHKATLVSLYEQLKKLKG